LNVVPGLGSAVIMKDTKGAIINASLGFGGMAVVLIFAQGYVSGLDAALIGTGLALWLPCGIAWNSYRSITYHHPESKKVAANPLQGLNVAVLPDPDGNIKGYVAYRVEF